MIMRNLIESFDNQKESIVDILMLKINATDSINSLTSKIIIPISTILNLPVNYYVSNIFS